MIAQFEIMSAIKEFMRLGGEIFGIFLVVS